MSDQFPYNEIYEWESKIFLGEGSYGKVFKVRNRQSGQFYAIKQMDMTEFNKDEMLMKSLIGQINITMDVTSPNTVKMLSYQIGKKYTYIALELCDSDLRKELASRKFTQCESVKAFQDIIMGFEIMVKKGYIHRDIKPANVLFKNKIYKVADFGFSCKADVFGQKKMQDICGTPLYMAPQLLQNKPYTAKSDIWSLGLMYYEMVFGYTPWPCRSLEQYTKYILSQPLKFPYDAKIGQNSKDFIRKTLVVKQQKRMTWQQLFQHPLIKQGKVGDIIKQIEVNMFEKDVLIRLQQKMLKNQCKIKQIIAKYNLTKIDLHLFTQLLRDIDSTITSNQINTIFNFIDKDKSGFLTYDQLQQKIFKTDYRGHQDVLGRKVDQIAAIIKNRNADINEIFQKCDYKKNGTLDFQQFAYFIRLVAPNYRQQQVEQLFVHFDKDKNGTISRQQFFSLIMKQVPVQISKSKIYQQRAKRNLKNLQYFLVSKNISKQAFMQLADLNKDRAINLQEFGQVLSKRFGFYISNEQVTQLFRYINKDTRDVILLEDLMTFLR